MSDDYYYDMGYFTGFGSLHTLTHDAAPRDVVAELHDVVKEITGERPVAPEPRRIGFV